MARSRWFRLPVVRGIVAFGESFAIGFRALAIFANVAAQEEGDDGEITIEFLCGQLIFVFAIVIGFAVLFFKVVLVLITNWLLIEMIGLFVVVEGLICVTIFVAYFVLILFIFDLRRVFQYYAAEHKVINAYEAKKP